MNGLLDGRRYVTYSGNSVGDGGSDRLVDGGVRMSLVIVIVALVWLSLAVVDVVDVVVEDQVTDNSKDRVGVSRMTSTEVQQGALMLKLGLIIQVVKDRESAITWMQISM